MIFCIISTAVFCLALVFVGVLKEMNTLPNGKLGIKKLVKKINAIKDVKRFSPDAYPLNITLQDKKFKVEVNKVHGVESFAYKTIPYYSCEEVCINEEPVLRVHHIYTLFKDYSYLDFTENRKLEEISLIINRACNKADSLYSEYLHSACHTNRCESSFFNN
jgi:hypothetical protein